MDVQSPIYKLTEIEEKNQDYVNTSDDGFCETPVGFNFFLLTNVRRF